MPKYLTQEALDEIQKRCDALPELKIEVQTEGLIGDCPLCQGEGQIDYSDLSDNQNSGSGFAAGWEAYGIGTDLDIAEAFAKNSFADIPNLLYTVKILDIALRRAIIYDSDWVSQDRYEEAEEDYQYYIEKAQKQLNSVVKPTK